LQEIGLAAQRRAKVAWALAEIEEHLGVAPALVHPVRGTDHAYGYRNKVELSFGVRRYLSEADHAAGLPVTGRYLGFHAAGRFDRVVDTERCELVSEPMQRVLFQVRKLVLTETAAAPWDVRAHTGGWRHVILREGRATGEILIAVVTSSEVRADEVAAVAAGLRAAEPNVVGVVWAVTDGVADVARGEVREVWGRPWLEERLGDVSFRLSPWSFFQTNTEAARVLYDVVGETLGTEPRPLLDLYCGIGSISLYLRARATRVLGIEEVPEAVADARENAARAGVDATFLAAKVEDALDHLAGWEGAQVVVDPPRAGLHPKVARRLASWPGEELVYVACHPASLGRDARILAEGGFDLVEVTPVDLFPQTGHLEVVGRLRRR
jgi:23S rRNA (uracil1939-C5)-methyltransferase